MSRFHKRDRLPGIFTTTMVLVVITASCGPVSKPRVPVEFQTELAGSLLYAGDRPAAAGHVAGTAEFFLEPPLAIPPLVSLELEYVSGGTLSYGDAARSAGKPGGKAGGETDRAAVSFMLPDLPDLTLGGPGTAAFRYTVPLEGDTLGIIRIAVPGDSALELSYLGLAGRWYGLDRDERGLRLSPFVVMETPGSVGIEVPESFAFPGGADLLIRSGGTVSWTIGNIRFERRGGGEFRVPSGVFPGPAPRVLVEGDDIRSVRLVPALSRPFPSPIPLDPAMILSYPVSSWRREDYEVFRWDAFPSLLIFDTADYAVQDRLFKRLAFFVEKAGYRGRLAEDWEIADQHGWNAHDYRAQDLARFFQAVQLADFPLLPEERELEALLFDSGIILEDEGRVAPGEGGIISISRESESYLRGLFMAHEGFHGVFFIDGEFREFSRRRWEGLSSPARRFILSYFDYQHYDTADEYLMINEFMAHVLQQPVSRAAVYFGETLASRIDASPWRRTVLPEKDEAGGNWPVLAEAFLAEAVAFDAYVSGRWGLGAGRVHRISVRE
ncbi:MAG: hypothetical protein LBF95_02965 [Treponema sp.]|nr:hypothetical protein [Treponema sp.]